MVYPYYHVIHGTQTLRVFHDVEKAEEHATTLRRTLSKVYVIGSYFG